MLGTLGEAHAESAGYDMQTLERLVREIEPDLLCAEIRPEDWEAGDPEGATPEYRDVLLPLSRRTDIVVVPVAGARNPGLITPRSGRLLGLRSLAVRMLNAHLRWMRRSARSPEQINSGWWGALCDRTCSMTASLCGRETRREWDEANRAILEKVLAAIRRDPGRRVLVTLDCRRRHRLERDLRRAPEVELVPHRDL